MGGEEIEDLRVEAAAQRSIVSEILEHESTDDVVLVAERNHDGRMIVDVEVPRSGRQGLIDGGDAVTLDFGDELGRPGQPYVIEMLPGVADLEGNETGSSRYWDCLLYTSDAADDRRGGEVGVGGGGV